MRGFARRRSGAPRRGADGVTPALGRSLPCIALLLGLAACASRQPAASRDGAAHPLIGRYWDVRAGTWVDEARVAAAAGSAHFVLLGETHDNPEHHRLQARMLQAIVAAGRKPAVAFEMLDADVQPKVDAALARDARDPDALAAAVGWAKTGWPDFALYRPIFATALDAGLPIVATNLPRQRARAVVSRGASVLEPRVRELLERAGPLSPEALGELREEMAASHCGQMPESMLDPLVLMQRARDAAIATRVLEAGRERGSVLIAGTGHVRADRGVPSYLEREAPDRSRLTIAFLEVSPDERSLDGYAQRFASERFPFDFVGFTVRQEREDPCIGIEKHIRPIAPEPEGASWVRRVDAPAQR